MGSEDTEVRWLSRGKVLSRLFELRNELCCFLSDNASPLATLFKNNNWIAKLAYLAYIFTKLNELNHSLQGRDTTIVKLYDRVGGFLKKTELWKRLCAEGDFSCFPQFDDFVTLPVHLREELLDLSTDRGLQTTFENCSLTEFWEQ